MRWQSNLSGPKSKEGGLSNAEKGEWPKAVFYDSKNTLWAWDDDEGWYRAEPSFQGLGARRVGREAGMKAAALTV